MTQLPRFRSAARSDVGRQRDSNEDRYVHRPANGLFAVIDGVGGYAGGEVAAEEARDALVRRLSHRTGSAEVRLREAVVLANNAIYERARREEKLARMSCVLTVVLLDGARLHAAHVGDTRLYKLRRGQVEKLTHDHSVVGVREDAGELSEAEAMRHPRRNEILRDVGSEAHTADDPSFIQYVAADFEPDAALLLCSDGLTDLVPERAFARVFDDLAGDPEAIAARLIELANEAGGTDNITVVVVEGEAFGQDAQAELSADEVAGAVPTTVDPAEKNGLPEATEAETGVPLHERFSRLTYFAGGMAVMLAVLLVGVGVWAFVNAAPPAEAARESLDSLRTTLGASFATDAAEAADWTAPAALQPRLELYRLPSGALHLDAPPADSSAPSPRLRGFYFPVSSSDSIAPSAFAFGVLVEGWTDSTTLRLVFSPADSAAAARP